MLTTRKWNSNLNVGIGLIDNQHKIIFDLINDLKKAIYAQADKKIVDTLSDVIENYIYRHFESEEDLLIGHEKHTDHCLEHYSFIKELRKHKLYTKNTNTYSDQLALFMEKWFCDHIAKYDNSMFSELSNGCSGENDVKVDEYSFEFKENRKHRRISRKKITDEEIVATCYNTSSLKNCDAKLVDISLGGMRIRTGASFSVGDLIVVSCNLGNSFKMREKIRILNDQQGSYGAEFIDLAPKTEKFLVELYGAISLGQNVKTT